MLREAVPGSGSVGLSCSNQPRLRFGVGGVAAVDSGETALGFRWGYGRDSVRTLRIKSLATWWAMVTIPGQVLTAPKAQASGGRVSNPGPEQHDPKLGPGGPSFSLHEKTNDPRNKNPGPIAYDPYEHELPPISVSGKDSTVRAEGRVQAHGSMTLTWDLAERATA
jgi:hypothetical protein